MHTIFFVTILFNLRALLMGKQEKLIVTIKGTAAGWAGREIALRGKIAIRLSNTNFYITGRPQPGMRIPIGGSTSSLIIYKAANPNRLFRLDYHGLNQLGGRPVWHYNTTSGFAEIKGLTRGTRARTNHAVTLGSKATGRIITIFKWGGRAMFVVGGVMSAIEIYHARNRKREITRQVGGWSASIAMARTGAAGGAKIGATIAVAAGQLGPQVAAPEEIVTVPLGATIGSIAGGVAGGIVGWTFGTKISEVVFDWIFTPLHKEEWIIYNQD